MTERTVSVRYQALMDTYKAALAEGAVANKAFSASVGDAITSVGSRFGTLGTQASKYLGGMVGDMGAATLGAAALGAGVAVLADKGIKSFLELGQQIRSFQLVTGASAKDASEFVGVFNELGIDSGKAGQAILHLNTEINTHADVLAADGVVVAKTKAGQVDLVATLESVADAYQRAGGGADGLTIAQDAFGSRAARNLLPVLQLTRGELQKLFAEVQAHGGVMTQNDVDNAYQMHLAMNGLNEAIQGFERGLVTGVVPALTSFVEKLGEVVDLGIKAEHATAWVWDKIPSFVKTAATDALVPGAALLNHPGSGSKAATDETKDAAAAEETLAERADDVAAATKREDDARKELADTTKTYTAALQQVTDSELKGMETQDSYQKGLVDFANTIKQAESDGDKFARSLDAGTDAGLRNRGALDGLARSALDHATALKAQGASADQVAAALAGDENELAALGARLGISQGDLAPWIKVMQDAAFAARDFSFASSQALSNPALAGLINAVQYLGVYAPPSATPKSYVPPNVGAAASGANVTVPKASSSSGKTDAQKAVEAFFDAIAQQQQVEDAQWQHGFITNEKYKQLLDQRLANQQTFSADWFDTLDKEEAIQQKINDAATAAADAAKKAADDQAAALQKRNDDLAKALQDEASILQKALDDLTQRRDALFNWADPNQKITVGWANSTSALTKNIQDQTSQLKEWGQLLAQLESEGLSTAAVSLLGLDKGPSSLGELRQLAKDPSQLAGLNSAAASRFDISGAVASAQPVQVINAPEFNVDVKIGDESFAGMVTTVITQINNRAAVVGAH